MTSPRVLVREEAKARQKGSEPAPELGWYLLGGLGLVFVLAAGTDILLAWYPTNFGMAEWKFGTVSATLNGFPLFALGIILLTASGLARGRIWVARVTAIVLILTVVALIGCAVLYLPEVGKALTSVTEPAIKMGLKRAITKTIAQLILYPIVLSWIALLTLRRLRSM